MKKLLFIGLMIGASSVAGANTPLTIQYGNPAPIDKAVITTTPYHAQENLISQYSLAFGYAGSKIGADSFLGTESFDGLFINGEYQSHPTASLWAEYKFQSSDIDYNQVAIGIKNKFLENDQLYSAVSIGLGMSWVDESETDADLGRIDLELDYFTIPVALEVGYKVAPEADLIGSFGYQWMFNRDAKICMNGACVSGKSDDLDLNGVTYQFGFRYYF